jgi:uncharacterized protein (TIGR03437 family)
MQIIGIDPRNGQNTAYARKNPQHAHAWRFSYTYGLSLTHCIAKWLFGIYALALGGLAFGQQGPVWLAVAASPPATNNTVLTITSPTPLPNGAVGAAYSFSFAADGGLAPYAWSVASGALPAGLNLGPSGSLTGTPTGAGQFAFTTLVTDYAQGPSAQTASKTFMLRVSPALSVTTTSPINATAGSSLTLILTAAGGTPLYLWTLAAGSQLPPGFMLDASSGFLSGTPTTAGTYSFTVNVMDSASNNTSKALVMIVAPALAITTASSPPSAAAGTNYSVTFAVSGGSPPFTWALDSGTLPPGLRLDPATGIISGTPQAAGAYSFAIRVTDSVKATVVKSITLTFTVASAGAAFSATSLDFSAQAGGDAPAPQSFAAAVSDGAGLQFTIQTDSGATGTAAPSWLSVLLLKGSTPARIPVAADQTGLQPGKYSGRILVNTSDGRQGVVTVTLTVVVGTPQLDVSPGFLRFAGSASSLAMAEQELLVRNTGGGGPLAFSVTVPSDSAWLSLSPSAGQTAPNAPVSLRVLVNAQTLAAGPLLGAIHIDSAAGSADIPVSLLVRTPGPVIGLSVNGVRFEAREKNGSAETQTVRVLNLGDGAVSWQAEIVSGSEWLSLGTSRGQSTEGTASSIQFSPNVAALGPGAYYALVRISDPGAVNSPQYVTAVVNVAGADTAANPQPDPAGLLFVAASGAAASPAQPVRVLISSSAPTPFQASANTADGGTWLSAVPASGSTSTLAPATVNVTVNPAGLAAGVYTGDVTFAFSSTIIRSTSITLVVQPSTTGAASTITRSAAGCTPTKLALAPSGLANNFATPAGWPSSLTMQLADDCGNPVLNGQVVTTFSNGDPALTMKLTDPGAGMYSATWSPGKISTPMTVTSRAAAPNLASAVRNMTGSVTPNKVPILAQNGVLNSLNPVAGAPLAPGTMANVSGSSLAPAQADTGVIPLPTEFNGTRVLIGALEVPLYSVSDGQLTIQIPVELQANTDYSIIVAANGGYTLPDSLTLAPVQPGVASSSGRLTAQHAADSSPVTADSPATQGEAIILTLVGMGATDPPVASGAAAPSDPMATTVIQPTVTVGGQKADIVFAALMPGAVGLYQIELTVPAGLAPGDQPVAVVQGSATANVAVLAVR